MAATLLCTSFLDAAFTSDLYSPSCNACLVRVENKRIRNDPYRASVIVASPKKHHEDRLPPVAARRLSEVFGFQAAAAPDTFAAPSNYFEECEEGEKFNATSADSVATSSFQAPQAERFAVVEFKHELCTYQAPFRVCEGDLVVVEADRGEHAGVVRHVLTERPQFNVPCRILRHGTAQDEEAIAAARPREDCCTSTIQKMSDNLGLGIRIVDTEFYSDNNKLTVFFASKTQVDFRKLQRSLFREFRCRIWLINYAEVQYRNKHFRNRK